MTTDQIAKFDKCCKYFDELRKVLGSSYETIGMTADGEEYLHKVGSDNKSEKSIRFSNKWNWKADLSDCSDPNFVQCYCKDLPYPKRRLYDGGPSKPIKASCVCIMQNGIYRVIFGEKYNRRTKQWGWIETSIEDVLQIVE